jgi:hypothetical protein
MIASAQEWLSVAGGHPELGQNLLVTPIGEATAAPHWTSL